MARYFPDWIAAYLEYTEHSEAPDVFHKWTAIATIAGALRRRVHVNMGYFKWYPNFFICFVAPPGIVSKSTTAEIGMSLLREVGGINFGPSAITWQALVTCLAESREDYPSGDGEYTPMCAVTYVASELGTLFPEKDTQIITVLTDLWDGREASFEKATKKDGVEVVVNPWLQMIGCTTPSWVAENWNTYFIGGGFSSRTLFVYANLKRQLVAYPQLRKNSKHNRLREKLVEDLKEISLLAGEYRLTEEAFAWGEEWYRRHFDADNPLQHNPLTAGYFSRKQTHLHKTAMVLAASRGPEMWLAKKDLERAEREISLLEPNIPAVFGQMNREGISAHMATILAVVHNHGSITKTALYRQFITKIGVRTFEEAVDGLLQSGLIRLSGSAAGILVTFAGEEVVKRVLERQEDSPPPLPGGEGNVD